MGDALCLVVNNEELVTNILYYCRIDDIEFYHKGPVLAAESSRLGRMNLMEEYIERGNYVRILSKNECGYIVDVQRQSRTCTVEAEDQNGDPILFDCSFDDIESRRRNMADELDLMRVFKVVKAEITKWNPYCVFPDAPEDEFDIECMEIASELYFEAPDDIAGIISRVFGYWFGEDEFPRDRCVKIASKIEKALKENSIVLTNQTNITYRRPASVADTPDYDNLDAVIDNWHPILLEYPFVRVGMTHREYIEEKAYYISGSLERFKMGLYSPIWKQLKKADKEEKRK